MTRLARRIVVCFAVLAGSIAGLNAQTVQFVYDELGRLVSVVAPNGESAVYIYDAVGNLLSIARYAATTVTLVEFTPNGGPIGAGVTLYGTGFSTTPSQNTVSFNGTAAAVQSATANQIVTSVPAAATTGPISVTTPFGSATSSTAFSVAAVLGAPLITSFSPGIGTPGTIVAVDGQSFDAAPVNNNVSFNVRRARVDSVVSMTRINTSVPAQATSGPIAVNTPAGNATSTSVFFVPPPPYTTPDVVYTGSFGPSENRTVAISTPTKIGLVTFVGTAGERLSVNLSAGPLGPLTIYNPDGSVLTTATMGAAPGFIEPTPLWASGTYTILVDPLSTNTGSITLTHYKVPADVSGSIVVDGPEVPVMIGTPGQNARFTFEGTAGRRISAKAVVTSGSFGCPWTIAIEKPDGSTLGSLSGTCGNSVLLEPLTLPVTGTYKYFVNPKTNGTGNASLNLYDVVDITGPISTNGSPVSVNITTPGQNGRFTFEGIAGRLVSATATATAALGCTWTFAILKPDASTLGSTATCGNSAFFGPVTLPVSGTYTYLVDPAASLTGSVTVSLYDVVDVAATVAVGGPAAPITIGTPGQNGNVTFGGTVGQQVTVRLTNNTIALVTVKLLNPAGTVLTSTTATPGNFNLATQTLAETGTFTILIDPSNQNTGVIEVRVTSP